MTIELNPGQSSVTGGQSSITGGQGALVKDAAATEMSAAHTKLAENLLQAKSRLVEARAAVVEQARHTALASDAYVRHHPWQVLGVAAAAGVLAGMLLSRRPGAAPRPGVR